MRSVVAESLEILRRRVPDTFLGHKTQEPFPREGYAAPEPSLTANEIETAGIRPE